MHVIGTAGHIDHGKSTLIRALTGIDPDRLKEEKERGMTIDLGFAWVTLPSGREAGIVDVPGHQRFIKNMLAGVGGIDLVLFVVAATESWMPQSQEHLDIITLLGIRRGIVVLTKSDLVEPDWLAMVTEEVRDKLSGSTLAEAEIIPVSSTTRQGLDMLVQAVDAMLAVTTPAADKGRARLWIDRVFTIRGAGTVVTGTLEGGNLHTEQVVQVLPAGVQARVRGLQTHHKSVEQAEPGSRVAVNLAGVETDAVQRGDVVAIPGQRRVSDTLNVLLEVIPTLDYEFPTECELKLHVGTAELLAQVRLLDKQTLSPGDNGMAQLRLEHPAAIDFADRFILRDATRQVTVGGGNVIDAHAQRVRGTDLRLPREAPGAYRVLSTAKVPVRHLNLDLLQARARASVAELPLIILAERGWASLEELAVEVPLAAASLRETINGYAAARQVVLLHTYAIAPTAWEALAQRLHAELRTFHDRYPLRLGLSRETLRSSLGMEPKLYEEAVDRMMLDGLLAGTGAILHLPGFTPTFTPVQSRDVEKIVALMHANAFSPPELDELAAVHGCDPEVTSALIDQGQLIKVNKNMVFSDKAVHEAKTKIAALAKQQGDIDVGEVRNILGTTRKYVVPLLEYLDQAGFTRRIGDKRILTECAGTP